MKSLKHEHLLYLLNLYKLGDNFVILTAQTDLGLRSRKFFSKKLMLPTFSEITQAWQCLKIGFLCQMSSHTKFQLRCRTYYSK